MAKKKEAEKFRPQLSTIMASPGKGFMSLHDLDEGQEGEGEGEGGGNEAAPMSGAALEFSSAFDLGPARPASPLLDAVASLQPRLLGVSTV
jgi:hypothetical protein